MEFAAAVEVCEIGAHFIPIFEAAELVDVADRGTATDVVAAGGWRVNRPCLETTSFAGAFPAGT